MRTTAAKVTIVIENDTHKRTIILPSTDGSVEVHYDYDEFSNNGLYFTVGRNRTPRAIQYTFNPLPADTAGDITDIVEEKGVTNESPIGF